MHLCELEISLTADTQQQQYLFAIISTDQTCSKHSRIKYKVKVLQSQVQVGLPVLGSKSKYSSSIAGTRILKSQLAVTSSALADVCAHFYHTNIDT